MTPDIIALLLAAGFAGGVANAIAGGATLITFPALLAAGLPPVIANASNAVAVTPGHVFGLIADRDRLPPLRSLAAVLVVALVAGALGAGLLLATSERVFTLLVPALIGAATLMFAFARRVQAAVRMLSSRGAAVRLVGLVCLYGGYFGAGLGIMLMAALSVTRDADMRSLNAIKNLISSTVSLATLAVFSLTASVSWPETLVMLAAAMAGGFAGGRLIRILPVAAVRAIVIGAGTLMTIIYAWRYWL